ncbi:MAG: hypothetical protein R6X27_11765 [Candidatus Desulfacyla sp.]
MKTKRSTHFPLTDKGTGRTAKEKVCLSEGMLLLFFALSARVEDFT